MIEIIALLCLSILFGGMVTFSFLFAPLVFAKLPPDLAGSFIRGFFPWYYLFVAVTAALAAAALWVIDPMMAIVAGAVALGGVVARQLLMPAINRARDRELAGDGSASRLFKTLHGGSVVLNLAQIIALGAILGWWAAGA